MVSIEVQYFHGCPNSDEMIKRVRAAMKQSVVETIYREVLVDTLEKAEMHKFRGSPTVLVNGLDLEGLPEPDSGHLACRYYRNGMPTIPSIIKIIENERLKEG